MLFATAGQGRLLVWMAGAGALIAVWYTLTCLLRRVVQADLARTALIDLLFGIGAAAIFLAFVFIGSHGAFRPYMLLGTAGGFFVFYIGMRAPVRRFCAWLRKHFDKIKNAIRRNRLNKLIFR